ncbi:MAG: hypothetical protein WC878_00280 [Candidatus Paceibacterota bacterium]|jgi:hypothetical protein
MEIARKIKQKNLLTSATDSNRNGKNAVQKAKNADNCDDKSD